MAELYISKLSNASDDNARIRIDVRNGATLLARIELNRDDFAAAMMGQGAVPAWFSTQRDKPGQQLPRDKDQL